MDIFQIILIITTFLCSLVAGFLFAFAVVVMPGIKKLNDAQFIRAFQVMDGIIQNNQPLFMLVWIGSILSVLASSAIGIWQLDDMNLVVLIIACAIYLPGVQAPTIRINIPLNNKLQTINTVKSSETELKSARENFEKRWNTSNRLRTVLSCLVSVLLIVLSSNL